MKGLIEKFRAFLRYNPGIFTLESGYAFGKHNRNFLNNAYPNIWDYTSNQSEDYLDSDPNSPMNETSSLFSEFESKIKKDESNEFRQVLFNDEDTVIGQIITPPSALVDVPVVVVPVEPVPSFRKVKSRSEQVEKVTIKETKSKK